jgi:hypothetical protein
MLKITGGAQEALKNWVCPWCHRKMERRVANETTDGELAQWHEFLNPQLSALKAVREALSDSPDAPLDHLDRAIRTMQQQVDCIPKVRQMMDRLRNERAQGE